MYVLFGPDRVTDSRVVLWRLSIPYFNSKMVVTSKTLVVWMRARCIGMQEISRHAELRSHRWRCSVDQAR